MAIGKRPSARKQGSSVALRGRTLLAAGVGAGGVCLATCGADGKRNDEQEPVAQRHSCEVEQMFRLGRHGNGRRCCRRQPILTDRWRVAGGPLRRGNRTRTGTTEVLRRDGPYGVRDERRQRARRIRHPHWHCPDWWRLPVRVRLGASASHHAGGERALGRSDVSVEWRRGRCSLRRGRAPRRRRDRWSGREAHVAWRLPTRSFSPGTASPFLRERGCVSPEDRDGSLGRTRSRGSRP